MGLSLVNARAAQAPADTTWGDVVTCWQAFVAAIDALAPNIKRLHLRFEPVMPLSKASQPHDVATPSIGAFISWRANSIVAGEADHVLFLTATQSALLQQVCVMRGLRFVDNTQAMASSVRRFCV